MYKPGPFKQDRLRLYNILCNTSNPDFLKKLMILITHQGLHSVAIYRFGRVAAYISSKNHLMGLIPLIIYKTMNFFIKTVHHVDISINADIGPGLIMMHSYSILIGSIKAGCNLTIHHNLTIGERIARLDHSIPEIGNNVWIGPQCVITGGIRIGDGATISAGTILSRDVPDNCLVAGNPGRVILKNYDNDIMAVRKKLKIKPE